MQNNYKILKTISGYNNIQIDKTYNENELIKYGLNVGNIKYLLTIQIIKIENDNVEVQEETDNKRIKIKKDKNIIE